MCVQTRKSCSEMNTKAALHYCQSAIFNLIKISKISQGLFYITAFAIKQDFRDNEKKMTTCWPFWTSSAKFVKGYPCTSPHIFFYVHGPAILLCF